MTEYTELARIERGTVKGTEGGGYLVESMDRAGLTTPPLKALRSGVSYSAGDRVYFFMFDDGDGKIIGSMQEG